MIYSPNFLLIIRNQFSSSFFRSYEQALLPYAVMAVEDMKIFVKIFFAKLKNLRIWNVIINRQTSSVSLYMNEWSLCQRLKIAGRRQNRLGA